jgi:hypothetical protein
MKRYTSVRLFLAAVLVVCVVPLLNAQRDFTHARQLVSQATDDLRKIRHLDSLSGKERERYDAALKHLSEFDQDLSKSKYDGGKLGDAIDDINNVCKNNAIAPEDRDVLQADMRALRDLRSDWK